MSTKIYCFVNSGKGTDMQHVYAISEDGHCLASHLSSNEWFAKHDIGYASDWQHEHYEKHCPDGYELIWLDEPQDSPELMVAFEKNQELGKLAAAKKASEEANK